MPDDEIERSEVDAVLETRRELGLRYDAELVDGFADRIENVVEKRVSGELAHGRRAESNQLAAGQRQFALGIVSLIACIPVCVPLGLQGQYPAILMALLAIVAVNYAHAWQSKQNP